jgi:F-type H+-transporting ATPase subunit b
MRRWVAVIFGLGVIAGFSANGGRLFAADSEPHQAEVGQEADMHVAEDQPSHGAAHGDPYDLAHQNATKSLEDPAEFRSDLAIWTFVVFICLAGLLFKFAWRPVVEGLAKREQSIATMISDAKRSAEKAAEQLRSYEERLAAASAEAQQIVARAQKDAEVAKDQIIVEAQSAARRERERAVADIENAKNSALQEMATKSVDLAVSMASRIMRRQLKPEDQSQLIREALEQLPSRN